MLKKILEKLNLASRKSQVMQDVNAFEESEKKKLKREDA